MGAEEGAASPLEEQPILSPGRTTIEEDVAAVLWRTTQLEVQLEELDARKRKQGGDADGNGRWRGDRRMLIPYGVLLGVVALLVACGFALATGHRATRGWVERLRRHVHLDL